MRFNRCPSCLGIDLRWLSIYHKYPTADAIARAPAERPLTQDEIAKALMNPRVFIR